MITHSEALQSLQDIAAKPVFSTAFHYLKKGTELALRLDDRIDFALFLTPQGVKVEERPARADVEFSFTAEAVRQLSGHSGEQMAHFGIAVLEQIIAGQMKIRVCGSLWKVLTDGYVKMIIAAGPEFLAFLAQHGISSSQKIIELIRTLKK
jgi:hypothetical protein